MDIYTAATLHIMTIRVRVRVNDNLKIIITIISDNITQYILIQLLDIDCAV